MVSSNGTGTPGPSPYQNWSKTVSSDFMNLVGPLIARNALVDPPPPPKKTLNPPKPKRPKSTKSDCKPQALSALLNIPKPKHTAAWRVWVGGCVGVWVCGCVGAWVCGCGCVGVWAHWCVGVWVCDGCSTTEKLPPVKPKRREAVG